MFEANVLTLRLKSDLLNEQFWYVFPYWEQKEDKIWIWFVSVDIIARVKCGHILGNGEDGQFLLTSHQMGASWIDVETTKHFCVL